MPGVGRYRLGWCAGWIVLSGMGEGVLCQHCQRQAWQCLRADLGSICHPRCGNCVCPWGKTNSPYTAFQLEKERGANYPHEEPLRKDPRPISPQVKRRYRSRGEASSPGSSPRRRRGAGAKGVRRCMRVAGRIGFRSSRQRGQGGVGGRRLGKPVRRVFYAAQIVLRIHPRPAR